MTKLSKKVVALGLALTMMMGTSSVLAKDYNTAGDGESLFGIGVTGVRTQNVSFSVPLYVVMVADLAAAPLGVPTTGYGIMNMSVPNVGGGGTNQPGTNSGDIRVTNMTVRALRDWTIAGTAANAKNITLNIGGVQVINPGTGAAQAITPTQEFATSTFAAGTSFAKDITPNEYRNIPLAGTTTAANVSTVTGGAVEVMSQFRVLYTVSGVANGNVIGLAPGVGDTNIWGPSMDVNPTP